MFLARFLSQNRSRKAATSHLWIAALPFVLLGCQTYQTKVSGARDMIRRGSTAEALKVLEPLANKDNDDQLVYMLDYATVLQESGQYKQSAQYFNKAEKLADIQDYHSLSRVTSSLLLSEEMKQYKGDDYEKVLIHAVNAVNYLEMNELDGALVEVRKLNTKLYKFKYEAKRDYEQNPFAFYLSALIYEADRKWDDAYIAFKQAYEVNPGYTPLREDLVRSAIRASRTEDLEKWKQSFPEVKIKPEWRDKTLGEVVLVFMQGWGPRKQPRPENPRFPKLVATHSMTAAARLICEDKGDAPSATVFSVEDVAIKTLNDDYGRLIATRVGGVVAKAVVADQLRQKNKLLGDLAFIAMNVADRADVRQWSTLPESFQIARLSLKAGRYKVRAIGVDDRGGPSNEEMPERQVVVKPGTKTFISWRSVR